jgi:hypothetical protein
MSVIKILVLVMMMSADPVEIPDRIVVPPVQVAGIASYYNSPQGDHGLRGNGIMANGEPITPGGMTIATRSVPLNTVVLLEYKGRRVWARSTDRGPYGAMHEGQWVLKIHRSDPGKWRGVADLNYPVAKKLLGDDMRNGLNHIKIRYWRREDPIWNLSSKE